jgi:hypothetical protein
MLSAASSYCARRPICWKSTCCVRVSVSSCWESPPAPYYIYLSRSERRAFTQVWPISLRAALPTVPLPLLPADPDVSLDMQAAVQECFALVGYERLLDYSGAPPSPELSTDDAAWVDEALRAAGYR